MPSDIAAILKDRMPDFAAQWAATRPTPRDGEEESSDSSFYLSAYQTLVAALRSGDYRPFLDQLYQEGFNLSLNGVKVSWVIARLLAASRVLREIVSGELGDDERERAKQLLDQLEERSLSAALEGYSAGEHRYIAAQEAAMSELNLRNHQQLGQTDRSLIARVAQLGALHKINAAANSSRDLDYLLQVAVDAVAEVLYVDVCSIFLYDSGDWLVLRATHGLSPDSVGVVMLRVGEGVTGRAAREGRPVAVRDAWNDPSFKYVPGIGEEAYSSILSVPVLLFAAGRSQGQLVGVLTIQTRDFREFSDDELKFLEILSGEIAIAIENTRLANATDERLHRKVNELNTLQWVSKLIVGNIDLGYVLDLIVRQALPLTQADMAAVFEFEPGSGALRIVASHGLSEEYVSKVRMPLGWGAVGEAVRSGEQVYVPDIHSWLADSGAIPDQQVSEAIISEGFTSMLCVPLVTARETLGGICIYTRQHHQFTDEQNELFRAFADLAALAIENARLYDDLRRSLATKSLLLRELQHRVRNNLQAVAALLSMQMRRVKGTAATSLRESVARIQSIAAVHDLLSREQVGQTSVADLVREIMGVVRTSLQAPSMELGLVVEGADSIAVRDKEATLLALILTELFSNAVLHGFSLDRVTAGGRVQANCIIHVSAARDDRDPTRVRLTVSDNGRGLDPNFSLATSANLGLQIVQTLTERDLGGRFSITPSALGGTMATVEFCT
jgi:two-component system, sensor histidine kinase PdtaS